MEERNGFLHVQNLNKEWGLVLPSTFNAEGKNSLEIAIVELHVATTHGGIEKTMKAFTDKFEYLLREFYILVYKLVVMRLIVVEYIRVGRTGVNAYSITIKL